MCPSFSHLPLTIYPWKKFKFSVGPFFLASRGSFFSDIWHKGQSQGGMWIRALLTVSPPLRLHTKMGLYLTFLWGKMRRSSLIDAQEPLQEKASMYVPFYVCTMYVCTSGQTDAKAGSPELPASLPILCHLFLLLEDLLVPQSITSSFTGKACKSQLMCLPLCHCLRS